MTALARRASALVLALSLPLVGGARLRAQPAPGATAAESLTLERAVELALAGNEVSGIAAARLEKAGAFKRQAVAQLIPTLTMTGSALRRAREVTREVGGEEVVVQALDAYNGQAAVESVLFDLRALPLIRGANRGLAAQGLESAELRRALAHDVAAGFYAVLGAEQLLAAARERVDVAHRTVDESRLRLEAGLANRNDLTRTELELATAELAVTQAKSIVTTSRLALGYLIVAPADGPLATPPGRPPIGVDRDSLVRQALASHPDIAAREERLEEARQFALAPRLGWVPRLDLRGLYRWTNEAGLSGNDEDWNLALNFTWDVFDGGDRGAAADQRDAEAREVELGLAQRRRQVTLEVDQALADLETAEAAYEQSRVRAEVARQNAEEVRERFQNGLATALEQTDSQVAQFEADAERVRSDYNRSIARLALEQALGAWPIDLSPPADVVLKESTP